MSEKLPEWNPNLAPMWSHVHGFDTSVVTGAMEHLPCWPSATTTSYCWCWRSTWKEWRLVPFSWKPEVMQNGSKWCNCEKQILRCRGYVHRRGAACKRYKKSKKLGLLISSLWVMRLTDHAIVGMYAKIDYCALHFFLLGPLESFTVVYCW